MGATRARVGFGWAGLATLTLAVVVLGGCAGAWPPLVVMQAEEPVQAAVAPAEIVAAVDSGAPARAATRATFDGELLVGTQMEPGAPAADLRAVQPVEWQYRGTATVAIRYDDYDASGATIQGQTRTYQRAVTVLIRAPDQCGSFTESSPFHMSAFSDMNPANPLDGDFALDTGASLVSPSGGCVLLDYWKLSMAGDHVTGELADIHAAEGGQRNLLYAMTAVTVIELVWPFPIERGATLEGNFTTQQLQFRVVGTSQDWTRPFTMEVEAQRVQ